MGAWRRVAGAFIAVVLAAGLFPTLRAIINGSGSQASIAPAPAVHTDIAPLVAAAIAARREAAPGSIRVMLVGNSVAFEFGPSFKALPGVAALDIGDPACTFPPTVTATYRNPLTNRSVALTPCHPASEAPIERAFVPRVVFWIVSDAPQPWSYRGRTMRPCSEPYDTLYESSLRREIDRLRTGGARVVVTTEAYVRFTVAGNGAGAVPLSDAAVDCNNRLRAAAAAAAGARLVDLFGWTCPRGRCLVKRDGVTLRPDGLHYRGPGGDLVAKWLIDQALIATARP